MPICNALMTKAYNLTCKAITVSGFMLLSPYLKRQTASKWQITRSNIYTGWRKKKVHAFDLV